MKEITLHSIGLMSGTSLDGLDLALVEFVFKGPNVKEYTVLFTRCVPYVSEQKAWLENLYSAPAEALIQADRAYGTWLGEQVAEFLEINNVSRESITCISSHGHTVFHNPQGGYTLQIGHGAYIAAAAQLPVVCDFRSGDVAYGGQGAPLVPMGDRLLFPRYDACLNLGGIANISYVPEEEPATVVAYDVCIANMALNALAQKNGFPFDRDGALAAQGSCIENLMQKIDALNYFRMPPPKSLGKEWYMKNFEPLLQFALQEYNVPDVLATVCCSIAAAIEQALHLTGKKNGNLLITGGGAFNKTLIYCIQQRIAPNWTVTIPDEKTIQFKEAIIFALLGGLRWLGLPNTLASVTGATRALAAGCIYLP